MPHIRNSRASAFLLALVATTLALAIAPPARALECGETFVEDTYQERSRFLEIDDQVVMVVHVTRTYTQEGEDRPFFRFVSSYVDLSDETGELRAGLDEGFIGHYSLNYQTGQEAWNGQGTLSPDEQACAILSG